MKPRPDSFRNYTRSIGTLMAAALVALLSACATLDPPDPEVVADNPCISGPYPVGHVDYNFEDEFDLVPTGGGPAAYPDVDVRATVRYPAQADGVQQPPARRPRRFPLVLFLHGNHATCPCSCSHACAAADRIPNHLGYDYLLDVLASWGFIAVSIDGFDVTCAGSFAMSDYEGRGRLVLRHLEMWEDWAASGNDPWGGLFRRRLDGTIGLSGHSRGGEGVVAAEYINRVENHGFDIVAVNAIAPTDQDPNINYVPQQPYFLLMAASDGDVSSLQGLRTYDRTSLEGAPIQSSKSMFWVYGANHNFFNTVWTPGFGAMCSSDDGSGQGRISDSDQRLVACQTIVPFFRHHGQDAGDVGWLPAAGGEEPLQGVEMYRSFQSRRRLEVDNFDDGGDNPNTNSAGGAVTTSGGFSTFDEFEFKSFGPDTFNSSFRHLTHGLVLGWNSTETYRTVLPVGARDVSAYRALSLRAGQILDGGMLNAADTPSTLRVTVESGSGSLANVDFDVIGLESVPYPYEDNGGKTVLSTIRIPLESFRADSQSFPLDDIQAVVLEFRGTGLVAIDDIQFTR